MAAPEPGRVAGTAIGRAGLSVLLVTLLLAVLAWNLPRDVAVRERLVPVARPLVSTLGLNQRWELFSPDPSTVSVEVLAEVVFADGAVHTYRFPDGEPFVGALREYRWRKFERRVRLDDRRALWRQTARWIADRFEDDAAEAGTTVAEVTLIRRSARTPRIGTDDPRIWTGERYYTYRPGVG